MKLLWILPVLAGLALLISYICYRMAFYVTKKQKAPEEYPIPVGQIYEPYREKMIAWIRETRAMPHKDLEITSFDGLTLRGKYYEYAPGATVELMFHGYRGNAERDLCGGVQRCFALGHSALIVDQRGCGRSDGRVITFGVNESRDCLRWIDCLRQLLGEDVKIILTGISMGAATVMAAAGRELPDNVVGILADCGYTSPEAIMKKVIRSMKLPAELAYPFVKLGARLYGGFHLEEISPIQAMAGCPVPVIFFHGEADDFVPCDMSRENYAACTARKRLVTIPGAGHGLSYPVDKERYLQAMREFFGE